MNELQRTLLGALEFSAFLLALPTAAAIVCVIRGILAEIQERRPR